MVNLANVPIKYVKLVTARNRSSVNVKLREINIKAIGKEQCQIGGMIESDIAPSVGELTNIIDGSFSNELSFPDNLFPTIIVTLSEARNDISRITIRLNDPHDQQTVYVSENKVDWFELIFEGEEEDWRRQKFLLPVESSIEFTKSIPTWTEVEHWDSMNISDGNQGTVEFWVKFKTPLPLPIEPQVIVDKGDLKTQQYYMLMDATSGTPQIKFRLGNSPEITVNRTNDLLGKWVHMAFVMDGTNIIYYENGQIIHQESALGYVFSYTNIRLSQGRTSDMQKWYGNFLFDEQRVWNIARSQQEIIDNKYKTDSTHPDLKGYWTFNNRGPEELTGKSHKGRMMNNPSFSLDVPDNPIISDVDIESSIEFTTAIPTWTEINNWDSMNISNGSYGTVEFWVKFKPNLPSEPQVIVDKGDLGLNQYYMLMDATTGTPQIKFRLGNSHEITVDRTNDLINKWVHMAFVMDGQTITYYENGEIIHQESGLNYVFSSTGIRLAQGRTSDVLQKWFGNFLFDEHRVWNIARTQLEIKNNLYGGINPTHPDLRGYWTFNNQTIIDLTGKSQPPKLLNDPSFPLDVPMPIIETPFLINLGALEINKIFLGNKQVTNLYLDNESLMGIPSKPKVEVTSLTNSIRLDWAETKNTTSWNIYRSEVKGTLGEKMSDGSFIKVNTYTDNTVIGGTTYYYTVESKNADSNKATKAEQVEAFPYSIQVYENKLVDFEGQTAWALYDEAHVTTDFGNVASWQGGTRIKYDTSGRVRFELPIGQLGSANTGGVIKAKIAGKNEYTMTYEIRFDTGFPWSKGGKIPGLSGGAGYTGGEGDLAKLNGDGFSVRMMWREDGRIIPYVYHAGMNDKYGDTFGATVGYFTNTQAHKVQYYVKLNTVGENYDGILRIYIDDVLAYENDKICYRRNQSQIDTCHIAIFAGGSTADWNMIDTGYIRLSYIEFQ
jgi:hypothetical protein